MNTQPIRRTHFYSLGQAEAVELERQQRELRRVSTRAIAYCAAAIALSVWGRPVADAIAMAFRAL